VFNGLCQQLHLYLTIAYSTSLVQQTSVNAQLTENKHYEIKEVGTLLTDVRSHLSFVNYVFIRVDSK
jgi:hypothetical protein